MFDRPGIEFDRRLATLERRLRDLASAPNDAGDNLVEPYLGLVWLMQSDGSDAVTYPATNAGLTAALAASGSGDVVRAGPSAYTSDISVPAGVMLFFYRGGTMTGQITLGDGASLAGANSARSVSSGSAISSVVGPSSGTAYIRDCHISAVNSGAGAAYGVNMGNGNLETYNCYVYGDDWAAYWTGAGTIRDIGSRWITTTSDSSGLFNEEFATDVTGWTTSGQVNNWAWDADHQGRTGLAYIEAYWAGPGTLARASQTIALPAGTYTVDASVYTTAGYNGYGIQVTGDAANSDTDATESAWTALTFNFTLAAAGTVVISFFVENDNPIPLGLRHLYVDYMRLTRSGGWATTSPASNPALLVTVGAMLSGAPAGAVNPGWSDRAAWDLSAEDKHASDINASALTRHLPTPPSASYGVVSDGVNWVASGSAMALTAAGTVGRLAEYSGSVALTPSTLVKTGAGVLTLDAASAYALTVANTGTVIVGAADAYVGTFAMKDGNTVKGGPLRTGLAQALDTGDYVDISLEIADHKVLDWAWSDASEAYVTYVSWKNTALASVRTIFEFSGNYSIAFAGNSSISGTLSGGGTVATGGFTLTVPATGTAALLGTANVFTATQTISGAQLLIQGGTTPGISFAGDTNTGVGNNNAADRLALYTDGAVRTLVGTSWVQMLVQLEATIGSSSFPGYSFRTDINTGMFGLDNDILAFATNSTERERIDANGNHSLGTTATPATGTKALTVASGTAVAAAVTDAFSLYSADMAGAAGKAWPHIYGEDTTNGALVVGVGAASQLAYWTANNVIASGSATITHAGVVNFVVGGTPPSANATTVISAVNCAAVGDLARIRIISGTAGQSILELGDSADTDIGGIVYDQGTDAWSVRTNNVSNRLVVNSAGVIKVAGTAVRATTEGTNHIDIFDGTAPIGTLANGCSIYSAAGELYTQDAAGNATLQTPHDKSGRWIYHSKNTVTGRVLEIDMERMMRAINEKFGWDFIREFVQ